jgi:hypothetical protein
MFVSNDEHGVNIHRLRSMRAPSAKPKPSLVQLSRDWWSLDIKGNPWYAFAYFSWLLFLLYNVLEAGHVIPCL